MCMYYRIEYFEMQKKNLYTLEADRISFSFSFSAPKNAFFYFLAFYFSAEKDAHILGVFYFSV